MIVAHHEALLVVQIAGPIGLGGWAAAIGARWYSLTHRSRARSHGVRTIDGGSSLSDTR